jgi:hypothetical protein
VAILPYIEEAFLQKEFHLDEPWDSPHNIKLLEKMPKTSQSSWGGDPGRGTTRFQVLVGPGTAFERDGLKIDDFPNGLGNTAFVVEAANAAPWTKPEDLTYDPIGPFPKLMSHNEQYHFLCYGFGRIPSHLICMGDGKARFIRVDTPESNIRSLVIRQANKKQR